MFEATATSVKRTKYASEGKDASNPAVGWNSERDCQRMVSKLGYTVNIPVQELEHRCELPSTTKLTTYHIRPQDWLQHWLENAPEILGGWSGDAPDNFKAFWELYRQTHGSHKVFTTHPDRLQHVVPLCVHGDEGRAVKKTNYLVMSIESPLGSLRDSKVEAPCFLDIAQPLLIFFHSMQQINLPPRKSSKMPEYNAVATPSEVHALMTWPKFQVSRPIEQLLNWIMPPWTLDVGRSQTTLDTLTSLGFWCLE